MLINIFLLKQKYVTAFIHSDPQMSKSINRLPSIANVIANQSLYLKLDFGITLL
ncbi:hypothetical protein yberc0001_31010 [Yersinia bercovieri ATCC 43970]|uniref:Uncharacterized protein n=1 Tax=Yersinia bercovieri ATCC 43970 TaxID=349968 RepID=A0ABM9XY89_YERBE|nr:hypothetical protein yberc0001_31010 [Yersinia bercovieri ATCC 43970]